MRIESSVISVSWIPSEVPTGLLQAIRDAQGKRGLREQDLGDKQTAEHGLEQAAAAAAARLAQTRQTAADELAAWTGRWSGPADARSRTPDKPQCPGRPPCSRILESIPLPSSRMSRRNKR